MPGPKLINSRTVWDHFALDLAFEAAVSIREHAAPNSDTWSKTLTATATSDSTFGCRADESYG